MTSERIDVLAVMDSLDGNTCSLELNAQVFRARAAVAELIEADREHDAARTALAELNRRIAEQGWLDVEFDALRKAGERFVHAQLRRAHALDRVGGAT